MLQARCVLCTHSLPISWPSGNVLVESQLYIFSVAEVISLQLFLVQGSGADVRFLLKTVAQGQMPQDIDCTSIQGIATEGLSALLTFIGKESSELLLASFSSEGITTLDAVAFPDDQEEDSLAISARRHHALHRIGQNTYLVVGGLLEVDYSTDKATALSDFYIVTLTQGVTRTLTVSGPLLLPYPIAGCTISTIGQSDSLPWEKRRHVLVGGYMDSAECNSYALEYDLEARTWVALSMDLSQMIPRHSHTAITISDRYIVSYGGFTASGMPLFDMWALDLGTMRAQPIELVDGLKLVGCSLYYDVVSDSLFLLSGRTPSDNKLKYEAYSIQGFVTMLHQQFNVLLVSQACKLPAQSQLINKNATPSSNFNDNESLQQTIRFLKHRLNTLEISYLKHIIFMRETLAVEREEKQRLLNMIERQLSFCSSRELRSTLVASLRQTSSMQISLSQVDSPNSIVNPQLTALDTSNELIESKNIVLALLSKINKIERELVSINTRLSGKQDGVFTA